MKGYLSWIIALKTLCLANESLIFEKDWLDIKREARINININLDKLSYAPT